ncbi:hypothetical protein JMJ35_000498 [Cladonia borealis]|uniref:Uncharacterized protein n=1 Tax=Cladonia borealis TaxID=184061 RepID=A0AA39RBK4_9LECA|nr:hypothetical protein JMJ35_000498 [Cladonia borealis]
MSTDLISYLNYMSTWDSETDENINSIINEHNLFVNLGDFSADSVIAREFRTLVDLADTLRDETIAADAVQIAADAAAVASIWTFGLGMAAFAALEVTEQIQQHYIAKKSGELNTKMQSIDTDISSRINSNVNNYIIAYKANNTLIASKAPEGLDTRTCRALLMQFMAEVEKDTRTTGVLDIPTFKNYAEAARRVYKSNEINNVYNALDTLSLSKKKTDAEVKQCIGSIVGLDFDTTALSLVRGFTIAIMFRKLQIARKTIRENAQEAGLDGAEVESNVFDALDAVGKFVTVVTVIMSVVDTVLRIIDIVDVVEQTKAWVDKLNGPIKESYTKYFDGIKTASKSYVAAVNQATPS